jgi:hypothetical protein
MAEKSRTKTGSPLIEPSQSSQGPELERRFRNLVANWQTEVAALSSTTARLRHPSYLAIIALGPEVVPLLLRELEQRPNHWFAALRSLTGADPVALADRGRIGPMADAWINWGKEHGYL